MRQTLLIATILFLAACIKFADQASVPQAESRQPWPEFAATVIEDYYRQNPEIACEAGLHEYDGRMSDLSAEGLATYEQWLRSVITAASAYEDLNASEAFERDY
jgi:hypothetical protein